MNSTTFYLIIFFNVESVRLAKPFARDNIVHVSVY